MGEYMKSYISTVAKPMLEVYYDTDAESPRTWDNLGYFILISSRYSSPDNDKGEIYNIVKETADEADNLENHIKLIKQRIKKEVGEKVLAIYPVTTYEHGNVNFSLGSKHGFDYSNNAFYIVTDKSAKKIGTPRKAFEEAIKSELETYTQWANGEVYRFALYDDKGELVDSCSGYYSIDDIHEVLPNEWQNEDLTKYLKIN